MNYDKSHCKYFIYGQMLVRLVPRLSSFVKPKKAAKPGNEATVVRAHSTVVLVIVLLVSTLIVRVVTPLVRRSIIPSRIIHAHKNAGGGGDISRRQLASHFCHWQYTKGCCLYTLHEPGKCQGALTTH